MRGRRVVTGDRVQPRLDVTLLQEPLEDLGRLLLRVVVGGLMLFHGVDKLRNGVAGVRADLVSAGLPGVLAWLTYAAEVLAPLLIIVGVWTRLAALLYAATMVVAIGLVHGDAFTRLEPTGAWAAEVYVFYVATPIAVALLGAGRYSVRRRRAFGD
jgi:putative oxidoreductase